MEPKPPVYSPQKAIHEIVEEQKKHANRPHSNEEDRETCFTLLSHLGNLAGRIATLRQKVNQKKVALIAEGKSVAAAEAETEASDEYANYKYAEAIEKMGYEAIADIKKFRDQQDKEYLHSNVG